MESEGSWRWETESSGTAERLLTHESACSGGIIGAERP